jgi:hypothetical protein
MKVYLFYTETVFQVFRSVRRAMAVAGPENENRIYVKAPSVPNPWFVHPVKKGKIDYDKMYTNIPKKRFKEWVRRG